MLSGMTFSYQNHGVCSKETRIDLDENGVIRDIEVLGGCNGNLKGLCSLLKGMQAQDAIERMSGLTCGARTTSCPDQVARALQEAVKAF